MRESIRTGRIAGIPFQAILMVAIVAAAAWMLRRTVFGRQILAIGGNERAARLAGIPVTSVKQRVYLISGLLSGIAGLIVIARNSAADANLVGLGMELDAIAAVAVGGTLLTGGRATVLGTLVGALIIQLVRYTLLANGVPDAAALVAKAVIIVLAVWLWRRPALASARRFDLQFRLGERVTTALELGTGTIRSNDELAIRQIADAYGLTMHG